MKSFDSLGMINHILYIQAFEIIISITSGCPVGWKLFRDNCYRYFKTKREFKDAKSACAKHDASLASESDK